MGQNFIEFRRTMARLEAQLKREETVITHKDYLREITCDFRRSFQVMTQRQICYSWEDLFPGFLWRK